MTTVERERQTGLPQVVDPRVERGAALLDERMPGWADMVNVTELQIQDCARCVVGQLFGWEDGLQLLGARWSWDYDFINAHAFAGTDEDTQDWRIAILSRRQA